MGSKYTKLTDEYVTPIPIKHADSNNFVILCCTRQNLTTLNLILYKIGSFDKIKNIINFPSQLRIKFDEKTQIIFMIEDYSKKWSMIFEVDYIIKNKLWYVPNKSIKEISTCHQQNIDLCFEKLI